MKISLIIAFYKNTNALGLILEALSRQVYKNFEVVIAEDDNNIQTLEYINKARENSKLQIKHVYQDVDDGFRKNKILNSAIKASDGEYMVFLDGDCIPHRKFLLAYANAAREDTVFFGRRVMLSESLTKKLYETKDLRLLSLWSLIASGSESIKYSFYLPFFKQQKKLGVYGCNWGVHKKHILAVNGYDEDYITAGVGEDNDIEWRLAGLGLHFRSLRYSAILYHLHHPLNYVDADTHVGYAQMKAKKAENLITCKNGLVKLD